MIINLDDYHKLDGLLAEARQGNDGPPLTLSFRINPGIGRGGFEGNYHRGQRCQIRHPL